MEISVSVLVVASAFLGILALIVSFLAFIRAGQIPNMPKKMFQSIADIEGAVAVMDQKLKTHTKSDASAKGVAARQAGASQPSLPTGGNGGVPGGDPYGDLERGLFPV